MAIADGALFGYETLEDVRRQEVPPGKDEVILRFEDSALGRPILRKCTKTGGATKDPMPKSAFTSIFKSTLTNAGYFCGLSIHAIRRQLGKAVDSESPCVAYPVTYVAVGPACQPSRLPPSKSSLTNLC